jgi:DNA-binding response OmpR family regulator
MLNPWHSSGGRVTSAELEATSKSFILNCTERTIEGIAMPPLLGGELKLLQFLGAHSARWHSCQMLSRLVYDRDDPTARQLVWKYVSMLRKKLAPSLPDLIEMCRRRGYRCRVPITIRQ